MKNLPPFMNARNRVAKERKKSVATGMELTPEQINNWRTHLMIQFPELPAIFFSDEVIQQHAKRVQEIAHSLLLPEPEYFEYTEAPYEKNS